MVLITLLRDTNTKKKRRKELSYRGFYALYERVEELHSASNNADDVNAASQNHNNASSPVTTDSSGFKILKMSSDESMPPVIRR